MVKFVKNIHLTRLMVGRVDGADWVGEEQEEPNFKVVEGALQ